MGAFLRIHGNIIYSTIRTSFDHNYVRRAIRHIREL
jgi:hypothetical protein